MMEWGRGGVRKERCGVRGKGGQERMEGRGMTGVEGGARRRDQGRGMRDERIDRMEEERGGKGE